MEVLVPISAQRDADRSYTALAAWFTTVLQPDGDVRLGEFRGPGATGSSNEMLPVDLSYERAGRTVEDSCVVRVAPTGYALFPDAAFEMQYRVLRALAPTPVPVLAVRCYEADLSVPRLEGFPPVEQTVARYEQRTGRTLRGAGLL